MNDLTWTCHICEEERPDAKISVLTKPLNIPGVIADENIRYCNDKSECVAGAQTFSFYKDRAQVSTDWLSAIEYELFETPIVLCKNCERMTFVIRELAHITKHTRENEMCVEDGDNYEFDEIFPDLSDDTKALLKTKGKDDDNND